MTLSGGGVFKEPAYLPAKWFWALVGLFGTSLVGAVWLGIWMQKQDTRYELLSIRVEAQEQNIVDDRKEMAYRATAVRPLFEAKLDKLQESINSVKNSVSNIEGRLGIKH